MNIRMQLVRAGAALAIIGSVAAAESLSPSATDADCPFAKAAKPQRIELLDPIQRHPTWIDARQESPGDGTLQSTVDSNHHDLTHGIVVS